MHIVLAGMAGVLGCLIGGTPSFMMTGLAGIISIVMKTTGYDTTWFDTNIVNLMFLPAVMFNGAVVATAYASKKHDIQGYETWRSLAFTNDPVVLIMASIGGIAGYCLFQLATILQFPCDCGAFSVLTIAIITRLLTPGKKYKKDGYEILHHLPHTLWLFHILFAGCIAFVFAWFGEITGNYTIGFSISALSLILLSIDSNFPATHHISLVAGYSMMVTHSLCISVLLGILSELLCYSFGIIYNDKCSSHLDPPTVPILLFSLILFIIQIYM